MQCSADDYNNTTFTIYRTSIYDYESNITSCIQSSETYYISELQEYVYYVTMTTLILPRGSFVSFTVISVVSIWLDLVRRCVITEVVNIVVEGNTVVVGRAVVVNVSVVCLA